MNRTDDRLSHGDELIAGLLTRQAEMLAHIRALLVVLVVVFLAGGIIGAVAASG